MRIEACMNAGTRAVRWARSKLKALGIVMSAGGGLQQQRVDVARRFWFAHTLCTQW